MSGGELKWPDIVLCALLSLFVSFFLLFLVFYGIVTEVAWDEDTKNIWQSLMPSARIRPSHLSPYTIFVGAEPE